jgi:hypothetical protein
VEEVLPGRSRPKYNSGTTFGTIEIALLRKTAIALGVLLTLSGTVRSQQEKKALQALSAEVKLQVPAGPLSGALEAIRKDAGVTWAVLPELLPPDLEVDAFSHSGPLQAALDRLVQPLNLKWQVGDFGSIVLLPKELRIPALDDWIARNFDVAGIELLDVEEFGQKLGFRSGDVLVALDGEKVGNYEGYRAMVLRDVKPDSGVQLTVRRGDEQIQIKATPDRRRPIGSLGVIRFIDAPSETALYEKGGHRNPKWDRSFSQAMDEFRQKDDSAWRPRAILDAVQRCSRSGCRDPQLAEMMVERVREFSAQRWKDTELCLNPAVLRSAYGGTKILTRARVAAEFLAHGDPAVRDRVRPLVECGWAATKDFRLGVRLAAAHFVEADYDACLRLLQAVHAPLGASMKLEDYPWVQLESQTLQRLGRYDDAFRLEEEYAQKVPLVHAQIPARFHQSTAPALKRVQPKPSVDRLPGPVGVLTWKTHSALDAIKMSWSSWGGHSLRDTGPGRYSPDLVNAPIPDSVEAYFFPKVLKNYQSAGYGGTLCLAFGAAAGQKPDTPAGELEWTRSSVFRVNGGLFLTRTHGSLGFAGELPLPGFGNAYGDTIRFFKTPELVTVRCNGAWITTDAAPCLQDEGWMAMAVTTARGYVDVGILAPTSRPYDNDRIRELMERIAQPDVPREEKLKLWYEAVTLAPPGSAMRRVTGILPPELLTKVPPPPFPDDAPPLVELSVAQALERVKGSESVQWAVSDSADPDLVWCARSNGRIDCFSRRRFFTTSYPRPRGTNSEEFRIGEPLFDTDAVWFPTNRGLFRFDRLGDVLRSVPLGGLLADVPVTSLRLKDKELSVVAKNRWTLNLESGTWEPR